MSQKQTNIVILLALLVIIIFVTLGFFGLGGFTVSGTSPNQPAGDTSTQALIDEIQKTGSVSDLRVQDLTIGSGDAVKEGDTLTVNYTGVLPDGTVFDASANHGQPFTFTLGKDPVIKGWEQGVIGMKKGGRRLLAIPPSLGYGANAVGQIPPNSTLIFDVELLDVISN